VQEATGERLAAAELHRLHAAILERRDGGRRGKRRTAAAEAALEQALAVARLQGARWFALRAGRDLAALWRAAGRKADARALLTDVISGVDHAGGRPDFDEATALSAVL
jgi:hypothetical protein